MRPLFHRLLPELFGQTGVSYRSAIFDAAVENVTAEALLDRLVGAAGVPL